MERVPLMAKNAKKAAKNHHFGTFSVGMTLPEGVQEREDELRSDLKLKGSETIKTQAAGMVASTISADMGKNVDKLRPDLTFLLNAETGDIAITSRPIFFYGRYSKPAGLAQRRETCHQCSGAGCKKCRGTGFERKPNVEEQLRRRFEGFTGSKKMTFSWLGSEDKGSKVYAPGRPFVVEIKNPVKRVLPRSFLVRTRGKQVAMSSGRVLPSKPVSLPSFKFSTEIIATTATKVDAGALAEFRKAFRKAEVRFDRPYDRPTTKKVYKASARARGKKLVISAQLDGGLPVKRFVNGDQVSPSVSEVLKTEVRCRRFDICKVEETGEFEFAEIARSQKKN